MCDPVSAMMALTVASTAVSTVGGIQSSKAQQAMADYQGQLADVNAINADRAARDALERGELDALKHGREVAKLRGQQIQRMAASGVEVGYGSSGDLLGDTDVLAAEDTGRIYENANREAEGYRINAANYRADAAGSRMEKANLKTSMVINAGSTLLEGASTLTGQYAKYGKPKFGK